MNLIAVSSTHFDLDYFGGNGLKITPTVEGSHATVAVEVYTTPLSRGQGLVYTLYDGEKKELARLESADTRVEFALENVHLWHGRRDPYLYS